ncbi:MAG: hypothetical protein JW983_04745 [Elusimicrobia bacterium]|nr:hypothetical protein [Elusimicrobiota bacterium]
MKKLFLTIQVLILVLISRGIAKTEIKTNIAVAEFTASNVSRVDAVAVSNFFRMGLVTTNLFNVLERNNMEMILAEQKFQMSGCTDQKCAIRMGKLLNVEKMVTGDLSHFAGIYYITCHVLDVETGRITHSEKIQCISKSDLPDKAEELAEILGKRLTGKIPPKARVVTLKSRGIITEIKDTECVIINQGKLDGVKDRNIYYIYDSVKYEKTGKIRITKVETEYSEGRIVKIYKDKPEPGQTIKYAGRHRMHSFGIMGNWAISKEGTDLGGSENRNLSGYYDVVCLSGWGFQFSVGTVEEEKERRNIGDLTNLSVAIINVEYRSFRYTASAIAKYYYNYDYSVSPYFGVGLSKAIYKYHSADYPYFPRPYHRIILNDDEKETITPVLNIGADIFSNKKIHFAIDVKGYIALQNFSGFNPSLLVPSICLGYNW